jgi:hypothetical protein
MVLVEFRDGAVGIYPPPDPGNSGRFSANSLQRAAAGFSLKVKLFSNFYRHTRIGSVAPINDNPKVAQITDFLNLSVQTCKVTVVVKTSDFWW